MSNDDRRNGLLAWQWSDYPRGHADRRNLALHAIAVPLFWLGLALVVAAPFTRGLFALGGLLALGAALALEGHGHRQEREAPIPFRSRWDAVARLTVEQLVTFPRFLLSGGFTRAWRKPR